jgi:hypothetical protein
LGESSTVRELHGVLAATAQTVERLRGRNVRIRMDSFPAIRNLINGGGPIPELNILVREWWIRCRQYRITPLYEWVPREQNQRADHLSKILAANFTIRPEAERRVREWLEENGEAAISGSFWQRTRVQAPHTAHVQLRIEEMSRARVPACILVPKWLGQIWQPMLHAYSEARMEVGWAHDVYEEWSCDNQAKIEAHLLIPERRPISLEQERKKEERKVRAKEKRERDRKYAEADAREQAQADARRTTRDVEGVADRKRKQW